MSNSDEGEANYQEHNLSALIYDNLINIRGSVPWIVELDGIIAGIQAYHDTSYSIIGFSFLLLLSMFLVS